MTTAPAAFLAHGSPTSALGGDAHAEALRAFGDAHREIRAALVISAHWQRPMPPAITAWEHAPLIYDFGGFPRELYEIRYAAPGDPALAEVLAGQLRAAGLECVLEPARGLDHGAWVPLRLAWPEASIPVLELSLPDAPPRDLVAMGEALRPLRRDGVAILGSGGIVHNLRRVVLHNKEAPPEAWATAFDDWVWARVERRDIDGLLQYRLDAPGAALAVPTPEHFDPVFVAVGASFPEERPQTVYAGFQYGTLSMRSFVFG